MQYRPLPLSLVVYVQAAIEQEANRADVAAVHRSEQGGGAGAAHRVDVRLLGQQELHGLCIAAGGGDHQRRAAVDGRQIRIGAVVQQQLQVRRAEPLGGGEIQRGAPVLGLGVDVGPP